MCEQEWCIVISVRTTQFSADILTKNANMKWQQINHVGYVWWQTTTPSAVADELSNYCNVSYSI